MCALDIQISPKRCDLVADLLAQLRSNLAQCQPCRLQAGFAHLLDLGNRSANRSGNAPIDLRPSSEPRQRRSSSVKTFDPKDYPARPSASSSPSRARTHRRDECGASQLSRRRWSRGKSHRRASSRRVVRAFAIAALRYSESITSPLRRRQPGDGGIVEPRP